LLVNVRDAWLLGCDHGGVTNGSPVTAGQRIVEAIERLRGLGIAVDADEVGASTRYTVTRPAYRLIVTVESTRFLGLQFDLIGRDGSSVLHYFVDTDLYDISQPKYAWFSQEIADDIVAFLSALIERRIWIMADESEPAMIVPTRDDLRLVKRGRFGTTVSPLAMAIAPAAPDGFTPMAW
jgi:hypothetical protein